MLKTLAELDKIYLQDEIRINDDNVNLLVAIAERNLGNRLRINCENKEKFNTYFFNCGKLRDYLKEKKNLYLYVGEMTISNYEDELFSGIGVEGYYEYEKKLYAMVEKAK